MSCIFLGTVNGRTTLSPDRGRLVILVTLPYGSLQATRRRNKIAFSFSMCGNVNGQKAILQRKFLHVMHRNSK